MDVKFYFTEHALIEMDNDDLEIEDVKYVASEGIIIENYSNDRPFPSMLKLGKSDSGWIHVVCAYDSDEIIHVITTYTPDPDKWDSTFTKRKNK